MLKNQVTQDLVKQFLEGAEEVKSLQALLLDHAKNKSKFRIAKVAGYKLAIIALSKSHNITTKELKTCILVEIVKK